MEIRSSQDQMVRSKELHKTQNELRMKREKTAEDMKKETFISLDETQRMDAFLRVLNNHRNDESFFENLPRLIKITVSEIEKESSRLNEHCESLKNKNNCYNQLFKDEVVAMEQ